MDQDRLQALIEPLLADHGLELESLDVTPVGKRRLVRVTVDGDGPEGRGPLLDDISAASSKISQALDASDVSGKAPYTLEVTTRGVNAPLRHATHYRRNRGRLVKLWLAEATQTGRIVEATDAEVTIEVDRTRHTYQLSEIDKAVVQVELNRPEEH
ncbi:MAG: ribosome maturation factor RimP [Arachnia sp.]